MKPADIAAFSDIAIRSGYPTHATLCAKILEDCLAYLLDTKRTRMPDVLMELKQKLSISQLNEVASNLKEKQSTMEEKFDAYLENKITAILERHLAGSHPPRKRDTIEHRKAA